MDIDTIKMLIQDFFQEGTVTIVGSGLSLAEGIPGMGDLAKELQVKVPKILSSSADIKNWKSIDDNLTKGVGLETALHNTKPRPFVEECIKKITAQYIGKADNTLFIDIVKNKKQLRFSEYLQRFNIRNHGMIVITTNYDRLIEYACEMNDIIADTLFTGKYIARYKPEQSKYIACRGIQRKSGKKSRMEYFPKVTILKPHGCLSWHLFNGEPYSLPNYPVEDSLIITPGLNKYRAGYNAPFDTHRERANNEIDKAQRYIIIGYGFGDGHLETHLIQQLNAGKPALLLTHCLSPRALELTRKCKHITAICSDGTDGSTIVTTTSETSIPHINLWDLKSMLREVF